MTQKYFVAIRRCRLCKQEIRFPLVEVSEPDEVWRNMALQDRFCDPQGAIHSCDGGGLGIMEFIGIQAVEK